MFLKRFKINQSSFIFSFTRYFIYILKNKNLFFIYKKKFFYENNFLTIGI